MARWGVVALGLGLCLLETGCVSRGIPSHGGGKRYFVEQRLLADALEEAMVGMNWESVKGQTVQLAVYAMGDEGGGISSGAAGVDIGGFFGFGGALSGNGAMAGIGSVTPTDDFTFASHAMANARDIEYIKGSFIEAIHKNGGRVAFGQDPSQIDGTVHVLLDRFGTEHTKTSILVYNEESLEAQASVRAFYAPLAAEDGTGDTHHSIGERNMGSSNVHERSILGISIPSKSAEE